MCDAALRGPGSGCQAESTARCISQCQDGWKSTRRSCCRSGRTLQVRVRCGWPAGRARARLGVPASTPRGFSCLNDLDRAESRHRVDQGEVEVTTLCSTRVGGWLSALHDRPNPCRYRSSMASESVGRTTTFPRPWWVELRGCLARSSRRPSVPACAIASPALLPRRRSLRSCRCRH